MEYFGNVIVFDLYNCGKKVYWFKVVIECLMGEVYLWIFKVIIGDNEVNIVDLVVVK